MSKEIEEYKTELSFLNDKLEKEKNNKSDLEEMIALLKKENEKLRKQAIKVKEDTIVPQEEVSVEERGFILVNPEGTLPSRVRHNQLDEKKIDKESHEITITNEELATSVDNDTVDFNINLFRDLKNCSPEDLATALATIKKLTTRSAFAELVYNKCLKNKELTHNVVQKIKDASSSVLIAQESAVLVKEYTREALYDELVKALLTFNNIPAGMTEEAASLHIIDKAVKTYGKKIPKDSSYAYKVDMIYNLLSEAVEKEFRDKSPEEQEQQLAEEWNALSPQQRDSLKNAYNADQATYEVFQSVCLRTGILSSLVVLSGSFSSYIALTTITHAFFTTLLGITLPFTIYTTLASTLSMVSGPVGAVVLAGIGGVAYRNISNAVTSAVLSIIIAIAMTGRGCSYMINSQGMPQWVNTSSVSFKLMMSQIAYIDELKEKFEKTSLEVFQAQNVILQKDAELNELRGRLEHEKKYYDLLAQKMKKSAKEKEYFMERYTYQKEKYEEVKDKYDKLEKEQKENKKRINKLLQQGDEQYKEIEEEKKKVLELEKKNKDLEKNFQYKVDEVANKRIEAMNLEAARKFGQEEPAIYDGDIRKALEHALENAEKEICIQSPFINKNTFTYSFHGRESLISLMKQALERGVIIKYSFGYALLEEQEANYRYHESHVKKLKAHIYDMNFIKSELFSYLDKNLFIVRGNDHSKIIILDKKYLLHSSYNSGSNKGKFEKGAAGDSALITQDKMKVESIYRKFFDFDRLLKEGIVVIDDYDPSMKSPKKYEKYANHIWS